MEYGEFGWTGVRVSRIGMGTYYDPPYILAAIVLRHKSRRTLKTTALQKGLELGINLIDTAEIYQTEDVVADAIRGHDREDLFIATKLFWNHHRYKEVLKAAENSLRRLRCSYIDLYQVHQPNPRVPIKETMKAMEKLVRTGKVRYVGVSNFSLQQVKETENALSENRLASNQVEYNLMTRGIEEDVLPYCERKNIAILAYRPIAHGALAHPETKLRAAMTSISQKHGTITPAQMALNWLTSKSKVIFPIPRASRLERVVENVGSLGWKLDAEEIMMLEEAAFAR